MKAAVLFSLLFSSHVSAQVLPAPVPTAALPQLPIVIERKVHIDVTFTPAEFVMIVEAACMLEEQTKGLLIVQLSQDIQFPVHRLPYQPPTHWSIRKTSAEHSSIVANDKELKATVYGLCERDINVIDLVTERILTKRDFLHVTMHEILHSIGVDHIQDSRESIMYPYLSTAPAEGDRPPLVLSDRDRVEFCAIAHCNPKDLK